MYNVLCLVKKHNIRRSFCDQSNHIFILKYIGKMLLSFSTAVRYNFVIRTEFNISAVKKNIIKKNNKTRNNIT